MVKVMEKLNIQPIIEGIRATVKSHEIEGRPGEYRRWIWQNEKGTRNLGKNEYGCADAMNLLYTINDFYCDEETRRARIAALQSMQDPETGLFHEATHHPYHTVAHCTGALQLFDVKPLYPITAFKKYLDSNGISSNKIDILHALARQENNIVGLHDRLNTLHEILKNQIIQQTRSIW